MKSFMHTCGNRAETTSVTKNKSSENNDGGQERKEELTDKK